MISIGRYAIAIDACSYTAMKNMYKSVDGKPTYGVLGYHNTIEQAVEQIARISGQEKNEIMKGIVDGRT